jgi:hypothetical protein
MPTDQFAYAGNMTTSDGPTNSRRESGKRFTHARGWLALGLVLVVISFLLFPQSVVASTIQFVLLLSLIWIAFFISVLDREVGDTPSHDAGVTHEQICVAVHAVSPGILRSQLQAFCYGYSLRTRSRRIETC